jgi:glycosyltransferase involved in cell wall biosynthesis
MNTSEELISSSIAKVGEKPVTSMPLIVNCAHITSREGFVESHTENMFRWLHFSATDPANIPFLGRNGNLRRFTSCLRAARAAQRLDANLVLTHDPRISFVVQHFLNACGYRGPHLASFFNYPWLPKGLKGSFHAWGLRGIDKFVVYSTMERRLYHEYFKIPLERFEFMHFGVALPKVDSPEKPIVDGDYLCALGGQSRDYRTFVESVRLLPEINAVIVARPENLIGIDIPHNIKVMTNIPYGQAMNVLAFSRFMALPLEGADVPCGHITMVNAMHLGKALGITRSTGVADYVREDENALTFSAGSVDEMTSVLRRMWCDPELCARLGAAGRAFAAAHCTEARSFAGFKRILRQLGIPLREPSD